MTESEAISEHDVLPAEVLGDTLIVAPHGDLLSYDYRDFRSELSNLKRVLHQPTLKHVIFDLSGSDYFGSQMLGGLVELKNELDEEGRAVLCHLSESQKVGLRITHIEDQFEIIPTLDDAVDTVTTLRMRDHARRLRQPVIALMLVGLVWGFFESPLSYRLFSGGLDDKYEELSDLWAKHRKGVPHVLLKEEALYWELNFQREVAATRSSLSRGWLHLTDDARSLSDAAIALDDIVQKREVNEFNRMVQFRKSMRTVRDHLANRIGVEVPEIYKAPVKHRFQTADLEDDDFSEDPADEEETAEDDDEVSIGIEQSLEMRIANTSAGRP